MQDESNIQAECYRWYHNTYCLKHHSPKGVMWSTPNEAVSTMVGVLKSVGITVPNKVVSRVSMYLRSMGLSKGVSDTTVILPTGQIIFVEFKTPVGKQSPEQVEFESTITNLGHPYFVVRSLEEFKGVVERLCVA